MVITSAIPNENYNYFHSSVQSIVAWAVNTGDSAEGNLNNLVYSGNWHSNLSEAL